MNGRGWETVFRARNDELEDNNHKTHEIHEKARRFYRGDAKDAEKTLFYV